MTAHSQTFYSHTVQNDLRWQGEPMQIHQVKPVGDSRFFVAGASFLAIPKELTNERTKNK